MTNSWCFQQVYMNIQAEKKIIAFLVLISQSNDVIILVVPVKGALTLELVEDKQDEQHWWQVERSHKGAERKVDEKYLRHNGLKWLQVELARWWYVGKIMTVWDLRIIFYELCFLETEVIYVDLSFSSPKNVVIGKSYHLILSMNYTYFKNMRLCKNPLKTLNVQYI